MKKKVLVTGGLGFIGSNWVNKYSKDFEIRIVDARKVGSDIDNINTQEQIAIFDINEIPEEYYEHFSPDYIINFAAESHVDRSIEDPLSFVQSNVNGTVKLLELMRKYTPSARFLHVSTDEVFGHLELDSEPFNELTRYNPRSPYSASKASSDHFVRAYAATYGLDIVITNCCNNYGPRQFREKLIPLIICNAFEDKPLPIYGKGLNIREWIHVNDHNEALTLVLTKGKSGETYCIGSGEEKTNIDVVTEICTYMDKHYPKKEGSYIDQITYVEDRKGHDLRYAIDSTKLKNEFGWEPRFKFAGGIRNTIQWYYDKYFREQFLFSSQNEDN
jgi:dTDP-glucose 4,6-dehydratase